MSQNYKELYEQLKAKTEQAPKKGYFSAIKKATSTFMVESELDQKADRLRNKIAVGALSFADKVAAK